MNKFPKQYQRSHKRTSEYQQTVQNIRAGKKAESQYPAQTRLITGVYAEANHKAVAVSPKTQHIAQMQNKANNSPRVQELARLQAIADQGSKGHKSASLQNNNTGGTGLPAQLKQGVEQLSGYAMDDVKVHYNSQKPAQLHALAYAKGSEIHLGPGQEKHLPHEAWHIAQQKQGKVKPTLQMKGQSINDEPFLEKEADLMGKKSLSIAANRETSLRSGSVYNQPAQLKIDGNGIDELRTYKALRLWELLSEEHRSYFTAWLRRDEDYSLSYFLDVINAPFTAQEADRVAESHLRGMVPQDHQEVAEEQQAEQKEQPPQPQQGLMKQIGPNCWIFVLQGILLEMRNSSVEGAPKLGASFLGQVLMGAPTEKQMEDAGFGRGTSGRREMAMKLMISHIKKFYSVLNMAPGREKSFTASVLERYAELAGISETKKFVKYLFAANEIRLSEKILKDPLKTHVRKAVMVAEKLEKMLKTAQYSKDHNAEANVLLGGSGTTVESVRAPQDRSGRNAQGQISDVRQALEQVRLPAYLGVRKRYKLTERLPDESYKYQAAVDQAKQTGEIDLTDRELDEMADTAHAILLIAINHDNVLIKDPNFPKYPIKLTLKQFAEMAGDTGLALRYRLVDNKLSELGDSAQDEK